MGRNRQSGRPFLAAVIIILIAIAILAAFGVIGFTPTLLLVLVAIISLSVIGSVMSSGKRVSGIRMFGMLVAVLVLIMALVALLAPTIVLLNSIIGILLIILVIFFFVELFTKK